MAYDERLAERIRCAMKVHPDITEKRMFGGLAFLKQGKMFCGVVKGELMVRVGPSRCGEFLRSHMYVQWTLPADP
jgi:TfoX/Sxy family transcriptional regulator of competence genes